MSQQRSATGIMKAIAILVTFALLASGAQAQSLKEKLSEQCKKRATEVFAKKSGGHAPVTTDTRWTFTTYQSHYNSRSNKCFYLLKRESQRENYRDNRGLHKMIMLLDLHENKSIGSYEGMTTEPTMEEKAFDCFVQGKRCASEEEWRALIKAFMEE
jgi:hypothetical protein